MSEPTPERWLPVPGYEGLYDVSNRGRIKSLPRNTTRGGILRQQRDRRGVGRVNLSKNGVESVWQVHALVLLAFVGPCPYGQEGCHGDGDPSNNRLENLRWDTHSANMQDAVRHGTAARMKVTHCPAGHEYNEENTYLYDGRRFCRPCAKERGRAFHQAAMAARAPVVIACRECGTPFERGDYKSAQRFYCSDNCKLTATRTRNRDRMRRVSAAKRTISNL